MTLIGFSLGARVVFKCLQCLAETEGDNGNPHNEFILVDKLSGSVIKKKEIEFSFFISAAGLVERVVLLGAPISIEDENWRDARKVVEIFLKKKRRLFPKFLCKLCCCSIIILTIPLDLFPVTCFYFFPNSDSRPISCYCSYKYH